MRQILNQVILTAFFFAVASGENYAAIAFDVLPLQLNVPVTREFQGGERQLFSIEARSGEALEIVADKRGVDIGLAVFAPDNGKISVSNAPHGFVGREAVFFVANQSGSYRIEVVSRRPGDFTGDYTINLINRRPARDDDSELAAAMRLLGEAREVLQGSANRVEKADEATAKLAKALVSFEKLNDLPNQANALFHIAYITGNEYGKDRRAAEIYEKALEIWRKIDDDAGVAINLTHAANELRGSGDNEKSLVYFNEALALNRKMKDQPDEAVTLSFLCRLYNNTQNFQKGFEACRASLTLTRDADPLTDYFTYSMLGNLFGNTGDTTSALKYILLSLERVNSVKEHLNPIRFASAQAAVASVFYQQKKYSEAIAYFEKSLLVSQAVNRSIFTAGFLTQLGSIYYDLGQYETALSYGEKALALYLRFDTGRRFDALNLVARSCAALGQKERARQIFTESVAFFRHNKDRYTEADALYNLAQLEMNDGNLETARQYLQSAINISEIIRADLLGTNSRSSYLTILKSYYELEIELLIKLDEKNPFAGYSEQAWQTHEKIRARSLLENFLENGLNLNSLAPPDFYTKEREMLEAIAEAERKRGEAEKTSDVSVQEKAERALQKSLENYQLMEEAVRRKNPQFSAVSQLKDFSFADVQNSLDGETALVEFALGKSQSHAWLIRKNSIKRFQLPACDVINQTARDFYTSLTAAKNEPLTAQNSKRLSRQVLQPFAGDLADVKRLVVIADGALQLIPFSALTLSPDAGFQPLAATLEITGAPSFSSLVYLRENKARRQSAPAKLLTIFADPIFQSDDERLAKHKPARSVPNSTDDSAKLAQTLRDFGIERLARLPFTGIEAKEIAKYAPQQTVLALGAQASRRKFLNGDYDAYKILHFATHGFLNQHNPDLSGLVLSLYDEQSSAQNGFLRVIDLYSMRLNADLVVLSACQTGLGKEVDGEGIVGLTRGFMFAGASSVVSSLWKVEDAATAELMKRFYRAMLKENQTPAAALRTAQNELRAIPRWRSPNNWAGFTLTGEWR